MKNYFPELDYWFNNYWNSRGEITVGNLYLPEIIDSSTCDNNNIFKLLFNEVFLYDNYNYNFIEQPINNFNRKVIDRLNTKRNKVKCYISDESGSNILSLTDNDVSMLDSLYLYKSADSTSALSDISFENLDTRFSQLVYIYLDYFINGNYERIKDIDSLLSSDKLLDKIYEVYVLNEIHKRMKIEEVILNSNSVKLSVSRKKFTIDTETIENQYIRLYDPIPYTQANIYLFLNGEILLPENYTIQENEEYWTISWTSTNLFILNDVVIVDYIFSRDGN